MPSIAADLFEQLRKNEIDTRQFFREAEKLSSDELRKLTELVQANSSDLHDLASSSPKR
jgi:hypothetical protein